MAVDYFGIVEHDVQISSATNELFVRSFCHDFQSFIGVVLLVYAVPYRQKAPSLSSHGDLVGNMLESFAAPSKDALLTL